MIAASIVVPLWLVALIVIVLLWLWLMRECDSDPFSYVLTTMAAAILSLAVLAIQGCVGW